MTNEYGYAGKILKVDLTTGKISHIPTSDYSEKYIGGRGMALKMYWDMVTPEIKPYDPENPVMFFTGPLAGFGGLSTSRCQIVTKSPSVDPIRFSYTNIGGHWGVHLKFAGYDGLIVVGKAEKPVYLVIKDDSVEIKDAAHLWQKTTFETREIVKGDLGNNFRVVASGPAGDNLVAFGGVLADHDSSGSSGTGAVMGSKNLKAIAVYGTGRPKAANPEKLKELVDYIRFLKHLSPEQLEKLAPKGGKKKREACFGCIGACNRVSYTADDGTQGKWICQSGNFYSVRAHRYYGRADTEVDFKATKLCDGYGMDTGVVESMVKWIVRGVSAGVLTEENTGLPLKKIGSLEFIQALTKMMAYREGFGDILANGVARAAETMGLGWDKVDPDFMSKGERFAAYGPRMLITTGFLWAMEPRQPIQQLHEVSSLVLQWVRTYKGDPDTFMTSDLVRRIGKRLWGDEIAADFSTYEGKALAAKRLQDRQFAKESLILCDFAWPIRESRWTEDNMGDLTVESKVFSAVTGREVDEDGLNKLGERIFNLQRAVLAREGHIGRESDKLWDVYHDSPLKVEFNNPDCLAPGKDGEPLDKKGWTIDRQKWEEMKTEYYGYRDWDVATGLQTRAKLNELGLGDFADDLAKIGALAEESKVSV